MSRSTVQRSSLLTLGLAILLTAVPHSSLSKNQENESSAMGFEPAAGSRRTVRLTSREPVADSIPAPEVGNCVLGETQYTIQVPANAIRMFVSVREVGESDDIDLYMRFGKRVVLRDSGIIADFKEKGEYAGEFIQLPYRNNGPPKEGTYFIAVANCGSKPSHFILSVFVTEAFEPDTVEIQEVGQFKGTMQAPQPGTCTLEQTQYALELPEPRVCGPFYDYSITLESDQDVKLYARLGHRVTSENGSVVSDKVSEPEYGSQVIHLRNYKSYDDPPDKFGIYYFAISNCGPGPATFTLTAGSPFIDIFGAVVGEIFLVGNDLHVAACNVPFDSVLVVKGEKLETIFRPLELVARGAGKKIAPGETVKIFVSAKGGRIGPYFFTRPAG
jgi:uncharacterized protein YneR